MYSFVFWFFLKFVEWRSGFESKILPSCMVFNTIIIHFFLIHSVLRFYTGFNIGVFSNDYLTNKLLWLPILLLFYFFTYKYFNDAKVKAILNNHRGNKAFAVKNFLLIFTVIVLPLLVSINLTNMAVTKFK